MKKSKHIFRKMASLSDNSESNLGQLCSLDSNMVSTTFAARDIAADEGMTSCWDDIKEVKLVQW